MFADLPENGDLIADKYRIDGLLGEGGYGIVYRAVTLTTGREVAVKLLKPGGDGYGTAEVGRFMRELRAIAKLESPHTVTLYDYGRTEAGLLFMVCEFVPGTDLSKRVSRRRPCTGGEVRHVLSQILDSLAEAHAMGILHRDIKPANIRLFEWSGDPLRVKVLDFGLARSYVERSVKLTGTGNLIGTPRYMAPEQMTGGTLTPASDLYSVGLLAAEMLVGPQVTQGAPAWTRDLQLEPSTCDEQLRGVVNRLLRRDPAARYQNAREVLADLRTSAPVEARTRKLPSVDSDGKTAVAEPPRRSGLRIAAGVTAVVCAAGLVWMLPSRDETAERPSPRVVRQPALIAEPTVEPDAAVLPDDGCRGGKSYEAGYHPIEGWRGIERAEVWVRIPEDYEPSVRHRPVVVLHDSGQGSKNVLEMVEHDAIGPRDVVIAPSEASWNNAWGQGRKVADIRDQLEIVARNLCLEESYYVVGYGRGGVGVDNMLCRGVNIAAVATTSHRNFPEGPVCPDILAVPRFEVFMLDDPVVMPDGSGCVGDFATIDAHVAYHRANSSCAGAERTASTHPLGDCVTWKCETPYVACRVAGGRPWKGSTLSQDLGSLLPICMSEASGFPFGQRIWAFFDRH